MTSFRQIFEPMRGAVCSPRSQLVYDEGRCRREGLIDFAKVSDLLELLSAFRRALFPKELNPSVLGIG